MQRVHVVLGNGESIRTGFGHYENAQTKNLYSHGVGPSLNGLFPQGNFGIVTSACIDLMPKPEEHMAAIVKIDSEEKLYDRNEWGDNTKLKFLRKYCLAPDTLKLKIGAQVMMLKNHFPCSG